MATTGLTGPNAAFNSHTNGDAQGAQAASSSSSVLSRIIVHVEVRLAQSYNVQLTKVRQQVEEYIRHTYTAEIQCERLLDDGWRSWPLLGKHVEQIRICESSRGSAIVPIGQASLIVHTFYAAAHDDMEELMTSDANAAGRGAGDGEYDNAAAGAQEDDVMAATVLELPNASLEGVWESLIYADNVKPRLLNYIFTTLRYSRADVDPNIIGWNRLLLLHGPPGTGKTSLCRALAHKLSVRLSDQFAYGKLIEINAHSLFSKWFSESGKLVQKLFSLITELATDEDGLIVVLIDEVESLTAARAGAASGGSEPGDSVRVVNALLTQLDKLKQRKNVLIATTSNLSESIDRAFLDRADIKQYIGPPPPEAIYWILQSCLQELMRVRLVEPVTLQPWHEAVDPKGSTDQASSAASSALAQLATQAQGFSGRTLRRLPVLAHARCLFGASLGAADETIPIALWLDAIQRTVQQVRTEIDDANRGSRMDDIIGQ